MTQVAQLWIPIVLSAVLVFVASSIIHMVLKWHNAEYRKLANEDAVRSAIRAGSAAPGQYVIPYCQDMKQMQAPEMQQKFIEGPVAFIVMRAAGPPKMGGLLVQWFIYGLVVALVTACLAGAVLPAGSGRQAGILIGAITFLLYGGRSVPDAIWMGKPWSAALKELLDALIYGAVTGATFAWLWPH
jgi:hypothetical protein